MCPKEAILPGFLAFLSRYRKSMRLLSSEVIFIQSKGAKFKEYAKKCKLCWVFPDFLTTSCCSKFKHVGRILSVFTLTRPDKLINMCPKEAILPGFLAILSRYRKSISLPSSEAIFIQPKGAKFKLELRKCNFCWDFLVFFLISGGSILLYKPGQCTPHMNFELD